jgi:pimeloyl-ACP methyl ester carboxylesterase
VKTKAGGLIVFFIFLVTPVAPLRAEQPVPVILVPGWGPPILEYWDDYVEFLTADGYRPQDIHVTAYSYLSDVETIRTQLEEQFKQIVGSYPSNTQFDVITHSMGQFVALYTIMEGGFAPVIRKLIGISGIAHGMDPEFCAFKICGEAMNDTLTPFMSDFLQSFYSTYQEPIAHLDKCSLYSPNDGLIRPYDSGKFEDGNNLAVPHMKHLRSIHHIRFYRAMRQTCYSK